MTQHDLSAGFVLDAGDYQQTIDEIDLLRDVRTAVAQIESGNGLSNREAKAALRRRLAG